MFQSKLCSIKCISRYVVQHQFFPKPSLREIVDGYEDMFDSIIAQREKFNAFAIAALSFCGVSYNQEHDEEVQRVFVNGNLNDQDLDDYEIARIAAKARVNNSLNRVIDLVGLGVRLVGKSFAFFVSMCF